MLLTALLTLIITVGLTAAQRSATPITGAIITDGMKFINTVVDTYAAHVQTINLVNATTHGKLIHEEIYDIIHALRRSLGAIDDHIQGRLPSLGEEEEKTVVEPLKNLVTHHTAALDIVIAAHKITTLVLQFPAIRFELQFWQSVIRDYGANMTYLITTQDEALHGEFGRLDDKLEEAIGKYGILVPG